MATRTQEVSQWDAQVQQAPGNAGAAPASAIYASAWPPAGQQGGANFSLALATADWALGLPGASSASPNSGRPAVRAGSPGAGGGRDLAGHPRHPPSSQRPARWPGNRHGHSGTEVGNAFVRTWSSPGGYVTPPGGGLQDTAIGYLLASEMTSVPQQKVSHVLAGAWGRWLNWHTTDAQLAAALGIPMPNVATESLPPGPNPPQAPLCT